MILMTEGKTLVGWEGAAQKAAMPQIEKLPAARSPQGLGKSGHQAAFFLVYSYFRYGARTLVYYILVSHYLKS